MKAHGETVGKVESAPLEMLYGSGQRRIMQRSLTPSCCRVRARAAKRRSVATIRCAKLRKRCREVMKAAVAPRMVAVEMMYQPVGKP